MINSGNRNRGNKNTSRFSGLRTQAATCDPSEDPWPENQSPSGFSRLPGNSSPARRG